MSSLPFRSALTGAILLAAATATADDRSVPAAANPAAPTPQPLYRSAFADQSAAETDVPAGDWRQLNDALRAPPAGSAQPQGAAPGPTMVPTMAPPSAGHHKH
jgi:hypothetical protein